MGGGARPGIIGAVDGIAFVITCLACGEPRETTRTQNGIEPPDCPACGYLGWREAALGVAIAPAPPDAPEPAAFC